MKASISLAGFSWRPRGFGGMSKRRWARALGWPGVVGAGLLAVCPALYFSGVLPAEERLDELHTLVATHERDGSAERAGRAAPRTVAEQLAQFHQTFPADSELVAGVEKIFAAAESGGLVLDRGEYKASRGSAGRLMWFQLTLPLKGEYPQIRKFLAGLLAELPHVALEQVQLERQRIGDPVIDAKVRLVLYLEQKP